MAVHSLPIYRRTAPIVGLAVVLLVGRGNVLVPDEERLCGAIPSWGERDSEPSHRSAEVHSQIDVTLERPRRPHMRSAQPHGPNCFVSSC